MNREVMDYTIALLNAEDLAGMHKLLDSFEDGGWIGSEEAAEWRRRIEGWEKFHELDTTRGQPA